MLDKSKMWFGVGSEEEGVDLVLLVKERKRLWAKTGTEMGATGGNLNTSINFRNVFGGGETVEATAAYGVETEGVLDRSVEMPLGSTATSSFSVGARNLRDLLLLSLLSVLLILAVCFWEASEGRSGSKTRDWCLSG